MENRIVRRTWYCGNEVSIHSEFGKVGRVTPCAPFERHGTRGGAHGVARPTQVRFGMLLSLWTHLTLRRFFVTVLARKLRAQRA